MQQQLVGSFLSPIETAAKLVSFAVAVKAKKRRGRGIPPLSLSRRSQYGVDREPLRPAKKQKVHLPTIFSAVRKKKRRIPVNAIDPDQTVVVLNPRQIATRAVNKCSLLKSRIGQRDS